MGAKYIPRKEIIFVLVTPPIFGATFLLLHNSSTMTMIDQSPFSSVPRIASFVVGVMILITGGYLMRKWGGTNVMDFSKPLSSYTDCLRFTGLTSWMVLSIVLSFMFMWPFLKQIIVFYFD